MRLAMKKQKEVLITVGILGFTFFLLGSAFLWKLRRFLSNSPEVFAAAPRIFRLFFPIFLFVGVVVIADYYLQSIMEERQSILLGLMHSAILSGLFCMILPLFSGMTGVWLALPLADLITASMGIFFYEEFKKVGIFTMMNSKEKKVAHLWWEEENDHS